MAETHNASDLKKSYKQLIIQYERVLVGAQVLGARALIDPILQVLISDILDLMITKKEELTKLKDLAKMQEILPIIQEQKQVFQEMRQLYKNVIQFNKPEKFDVRVCQSREYSHKFQVNYKAIDLLNGMILPHIEKFFQQQIVQKLEEQFDKLCKQVLEILKEDDIDVDYGVEKIQEIAPGTPFNVPIRKVLVDVKKTKNRNNHNVMKQLLNWDKQSKSKEEEGNKQLEQIKHSSKNTDVAKIVKDIQDDIKALQPLKNEHAKEFFQMFYKPQKETNVIVEHLYQAFCLYFEYKTSEVIEDTKKNQKLIIEAFDPESLVRASLEEINSFFDKYVDVNAAALKINGLTYTNYQNEVDYPNDKGVSSSDPSSDQNAMISKGQRRKGPSDDKIKHDPTINDNDQPRTIGGGALPQQSPKNGNNLVDSKNRRIGKHLYLEEEQKAPSYRKYNYKVKMTVLEDFDDEDAQSVEKRKTDGIIKAGVEREFEIMDGQSLKFGNDMFADVVIPIDELDANQFTILNKDGQLLLVDEGITHQTKMKVEHLRGFRLNQGDFIDLGLQQILHVVEATSEQQPQATDQKCFNIRYLPPRISKQVDDQMKDKNHLSDSLGPILTLAYKCGKDDGVQKSFKPQDLPENGIILIGRHHTCDILISSDLEDVSRKHCRITYDSHYGWMIMDGSEDSSSVSGTWVHPKNWQTATLTKNPSYPVSFYNEIQVKADTFTFQFEMKKIK